MDWILAHTHLPGLDTVQTIGSGVSLMIGAAIGKVVVNFATGVINQVTAQARKK